MTTRDLDSEYFESNPLLNWPEKVSRLKTTINILVISLSKLMPLKLKNRLLRAIDVEIGEDVAIGLSAQLDIFYPEKISIGKGTVIGYGATILAHEATTERFSIGEVDIGKNVLIGANTTVLPGVKIGDGASVSANSLVNRDVEPGEKVQGVPVQEVQTE